MFKSIIAVICILCSSIVLAITEQQFKSMDTTVLHNNKFKVKLLYLDKVEDSAYLDKVVGLGVNIKEKMPMMGAFLYEGVCYAFMQEKGIESVYKKLGLNADTIHVATAHEIGHCWSSYFLQAKQFDQFSGKKYKVSSVKEAEQKESSKAYRLHLERFGDIFATVYARRYQGNMQFLKVFRQIDNDQLYDTKKGIVLAENSHLNHLTIAEESAMILDQVY